MTRCCCFCDDDLENHAHNVQYPGGANRWLCGTCILYCDVTLHLEHLESLRVAQADGASEVEAKAAELATGIDEVSP